MTLSKSKQIDWEISSFFYDFFVNGISELCFSFTLLGQSRITYVMKLSFVRIIAQCVFSHCNFYYVITALEWVELAATLC